MMNDRYVSYVSYLKVSRMKYARVFFLRIFIYIRVYKLDPIETRFIYTECELKIRFQTGYLSLLSHFLPLWYEYTIFNVFGRRKNKREREGEGWIDGKFELNSTNLSAVRPRSKPCSENQSQRVTGTIQSILEDSFFPGPSAFREGMHNGTRLRKSNIRHRAKTP